MFEAAVPIAPPGAATHYENTHRRLRVDTVGEPLDPTVKPAPAQLEEILREVSVYRSRWAEINLTGIA